MMTKISCSLILYTDASQEKLLTNTLIHMKVLCIMYCVYYLLMLRSRVSPTDTLHVAYLCGTGNKQHSAAWYFSRFICIWYFMLLRERLEPATYKTLCALTVSHAQHPLEIKSKLESTYKNKDIIYISLQTHVDFNSEKHPEWNKDLLLETVWWNETLWSGSGETVSINICTDPADLLGLTSSPVNVTPSPAEPDLWAGRGFSDCCRRVNAGFTRNAVRFPAGRHTGRAGGNVKCATMWSITGDAPWCELKSQLFTYNVLD